MGRFFTFNGRINRLAYCGYIFLAGLITMIPQIIYALTENTFAFIIYILMYIAYVALSICLAVQRLHDIERPGTHWFLLLIPLYNIYLGFLLLFKKGTDGPNQYGEDPLAKKATM
ncbi:DUF805 domain-containing protein [Crassaminicella indica]|uniref:DUF805 domain-containing protein n=1 Tax=Crassaminicella indica TaxID=2855394 RepID=A0ABX8RDH4_9CLOT|nr:DUF805 domain-containing protein [Crassaminicella indica]QXM07083.1 DUF805 domain-containing protein [Crassaminicella indica]